MPEHLPPLNALRTFEVAARHLNFTVAADELHVTAAAVSHQIRLLEGHLGVALFRRSGRSLALTKAGRGLVPDIQHAFARIQSATKDVRGADAVRSKHSDPVLEPKGAQTITLALPLEFPRHSRSFVDYVE